MPRAVVQRIDRAEPFALAVVLRAEGSTPCKAGAKAIVDATGAIEGTVGGGAVEAEVQRRAIEAIRSSSGQVFDFSLHGGEGPVCGGSMRVLIDPSAAQHRAAHAAAAEALGRRARGVLLTTVARREPKTHPSEGQAAGAGQTVDVPHLTVSVRFLEEPAIARESDFPGAARLRAVLDGQQASWFDAGVAPDGTLQEVLVEPLIPRPVLLIVGGGHVGQALAALAGAVGFEIAVIDDRPEFADPERFPSGTTTRCGKIADEVAGFPIGPDTFIVLVTRSHEQDAEALAACLHRPAAYLGMIGSRRKVAHLRRAFLESGRATAEEFDRVYAPIGLDLGAVTVDEIAVSILAQLIAVRRRGMAPRMATRSEER
jgi:xanthine dehydrogenase accessory factor